VLAADLTGTSVVTDGGTPPGAAAGRAQAMLLLLQNRLCFTVTWSGIDAPAAAEIHAGVAGQNGPLEQALFQGELPGNIRGGTGCVETGNGLLDSLRSNGLGHYLTLRTSQLPDGAVRGQLRPQAAPVDLFRPFTGPLTVAADGPQETGKPGDPDGRATGSFAVRGNRATFAITWTSLARPTFGHVHVGMARQRGGKIVIPVFGVAAGLPGTLSGVAGTVDGLAPGVAQRINGQPACYYLRLHNAAFPDGAVRGQFARAR
jgi:hypothetical protein